MSVPDLDACLRRGAVFLWRTFTFADNPDGASKPKYLIIINTWLPHDTLYFVLTTSKVAKLLGGPFAAETVVFPAGSYDFFRRETAVNVGSITTESSVSAEDFRGFYYDGEVVYVGQLSNEDVKRLDRAIVASVRVPRDLKRHITDW